MGTEQTDQRESDGGLESQSPVALQVPEILKSSLSPEAHPSLAFSCADKLLWLFADQILGEKELAIAYPCLGCRGGLTLFLAYLSVSLQTKRTGRPFDPILVYPGTAEIRESYTALMIKVGDLLEGLSRIRVQAYDQGGSSLVYPWEERLMRRISRGQISKSDEYPLHDFFPAAVLDGDSVPHLLGGRHGFGRSDRAIPPLHFAVKIHNVSPDETYRAALLMHDALTTHAERKRLKENLQRISANTVIHLFESPFSPNFRRLVKQSVPSWSIRPADFPADGKLFLEDTELLRILDAERRIHMVPPPLDERGLDNLYENFGHLRKSAQGDNTIIEACRKLYNLYRFILTLPTPVDDYDVMAVDFGYATVMERIEDIREDATKLGPVDYSYFDDTLQKILSMEERLRNDPARSRAILTEVLRAREKGLRIGIVVTHKLYLSAVEHFLARSLVTDPMLLTSLGVHVVHIGSLRAIEPNDIFDVLVFPSYQGGNILRWIMSGKTREAVVVLTEAERRAIARDLREGTDIKNTWAPERRGPPMSLDDKPEEKLAKALGQVNSSLPILPLDDEGLVQGLFDQFPTGKPDEKKLVGPVECYKITFQNHYAFLPAGGAITVIKGKGSKTKAVKDLKPGDVVVFINHAQSQTIYDLMLDEIKRSPRFEPFVAVIQQWHRRLQSWFVNSSLSYSDLHHVLSQKGSKVVGATVATWVCGNTMAPLDSQNLSRLISLVGIPDPNGIVCKTVNDAAVRLRTVYRVYARAVNSFLIKAGGEDRSEVDDLLQKYNLDIGSIRDSVVKEEVVTASSELVSISSSVAGRLYGN